MEFTENSIEKLIEGIDLDREGKSSKSIEDTLQLEKLDIYLAELLRKIDPEMPESLKLAVKLLSVLNRMGHSCLDLAGRDGIWPKAAELAGIKKDFQSLKKEFSLSPLLREDLKSPLILSDKRLYFQKYFIAEDKIAEKLLKLAREKKTVDKEEIKEKIDLFFQDKTDKSDMQKLAAYTSLKGRLSIITGGPGTGKTSTVCRILGLINSLEGIKTIALAAPTGKAAGRLGEAIKEGKAKLTLSEEIKDSIPDTASTIHRLLALSYNKKSPFGEDNPLPYDTVVLDEVSMIDLFLMSQLIKALKKDARLILLGDAFQLASVMPGSVLGEICKYDLNKKSPDFIEDFKFLFKSEVPFKAEEELSPLADCIVNLKHSWRFESSSGIGRVSESINKGDYKGLIREFREDKNQELRWLDTKKDSFHNEFEELIIREFSKLCKAETISLAFKALEEFRILCLLNRGARGVEGVNRLVEDILKKAGLIKDKDIFYNKRPLIIVKNDPVNKLYNGDTGICIKDEDNKTRVYFPDKTEGFKSFHPMALPEFKTVFAMSVHRSQGSEFDHILLILPDQKLPLLSREILYTGASRARKKISLIGSEKVLEYGTKKNIKRSSGLGDMLWQKRRESGFFYEETN